MYTNNYRKGVGAFLINNHKKVFIAKRLNFTNAWQLPQGGIESNESSSQAILRELLEEIGTNKVEILKQLPPLRYEFITPLQKYSFNNKFIGQEIIWFALLLKDNEENINLNYSNHPEFSEWKWIEPKKIPSLIVDFKKDMYTKILSYMIQYNII